MKGTEPAAWVPEFIETSNLDGLRTVPGVKAQVETRWGLSSLAAAMGISEAEAARYALEVGIAALQREGVIG